jgi:hypothetical protein
LSIAPFKEFYLERNRYLILLKNLNTKTLILLTPALAITEIVTMGHAILNGPKYIKSKLMAYLWIIKHIRTILIKREETLSKKIISDKEFFGLLDWSIPFEQIIENHIMKRTTDIIFNSFYALNMKVIRRIV